MNKKITVKDQFNLKDLKNTSPVKGLVILKTANGKVIFKKNNLVVAEGRKLVKKLFYESIKIDGTDRVFPTFVPSIVIGNNSIVPADSDTLNNSFLTSIKITYENNQNTAPIDIETTLDESSDDIFIKFTATINGTGTTAINMQELGITLTEILEDGATEKPKEYLFSRITFDALPLTSDNTYTLDYYLYF